MQVRQKVDIDIIGQKFRDENMEVWYTCLETYSFNLF